ncbi:DUF2188 domain-containing protein [Cupriavidus necator]
METECVGRETFETQDEALAAGTERAKEKQVELLVHVLDGKVLERNSFGNEPRNVKGEAVVRRFLVGGCFGKHGPEKCDPSSELASHWSQCGAIFEMLSANRSRLAYRIEH